MRRIDHAAFAVTERGAGMFNLLSGSDCFVLWACPPAGFKRVHDSI